MQYSSDTPGLTFKSLGGEERDGHWVERVQVVVNEHVSRAPMMPVDLHITATGPNGVHPVEVTQRWPLLICNGCCPIRFFLDCLYAVNKKTVNGMSLYSPMP